jgi:predicted amidophosphoribosyltransferase
MLGSELVCPECKKPITPKTTRCPHCKKTISKKYIEHYQNAISKFWVVFLGTFILFLIVPFILYDYLGQKWTIITIITGIPISFVLGYLAKQMSSKKA